MERIDQNSFKPLFVNETTAYPDTVSIIQGTTIQFIQIEHIEALIDGLQKFIPKRENKFAQE